MQCRALPFRELPHQPPLHLAFLDDFQKVKTFYSHEPTLENATALAGTLNYPQTRRSAVAAVLREQNEGLKAGDAALNNISRLEKGAVAVVTGQQVGLFGGPAYSFYKALSAIETARLLTKSGVEAVPVFWMATEDHDLDEVRQVTFFNDGKLVKFELPPQTGAPTTVGPQKLGPEITEFVRAATVMLGGPAGGDVATLLRASYTPDETYASAFGKLFAGLFATHGLIILDPLDARLHRVAEPIYRQAAEDRGALNEALLARNKELERVGFAPQVKVTGKSTALFHMGAAGRWRPRRDCVFCAIRSVLFEALAPAAGIFLSRRIYLGGQQSAAFAGTVQDDRGRCLGRSADRSSETRRGECLRKA